MKKTYAILSVVLIALMCGYIVPAQVHAFDTGPGAPNTSWNEYGPSLTTLWVHGYSDYGGELSAIESKSIDFIDTTLLPSDYNTLLGLKSCNFTHIIELDIDELDFNTAFLPFNNTDYSIAVCNMLNVNKANAVSTWLGAGAEPAYSPVPGDIMQNSGYNWYNETTLEGLFTGGYGEALTLLCSLAEEPSTAYPLVVDQISGGGTLATWNYSAPFPVSGGLSYNPLAPAGTSAQGYNIMGDGADNSHGVGGVQVLNRVEDSRILIGPGPLGVVDSLGPLFEAWYKSLPPTSPYVSMWQTALTDAGLGAQKTTLYPYIEVANENVEFADVLGPVFTYYCFETYTGSYSYGILPSGMMDNYEISNAPQSFLWVPYHDDTCYVNPVFTGLEQLSENSTTQGSYSTVGSGVYWEQLAQLECMSDPAYGPPIFPYWDYTGYSPTLATDINCISEPGVGMNSWYSFLDAYPTSGSYLYSSNAMTYGMRSVTQDGCNVVSASAFYDYQVIDEIYDTLAIGNPYNPSNLTPYIANSWTMGTWANPGTGTTCSNITVNLRSDVEWQDVPGPENRAPFTYNNGTQLNGPLKDRYLNPLDVAFTLEYGSIGWAIDITYDITAGEFVDHCVVNPAWSGIWNDEWGMNKTVNGYPWMNVTAINDYVGASTLAWPLYQAVTPGVPGAPGYLNTTNYMQNFVQYSNGVATNQIVVYMSTFWPWQTPYFIVGSVILPRDIFSNLAINSLGWNGTSVQGHRFIPLDVCYMDLEPYSYNTGTGADLLYGTGPFILVDDAAAVPTTNFRLDAYRAGLTYGPGLTGGFGHDTITTDHSYFLSTPPPFVTTTSAEVGITGYKLVFNETLTNAHAANTTSYYWAYTVDELNTTSDLYSIPIVSSGKTSTYVGYSVPTGTSSVLNTMDAVLPKPFPAYNTDILVVSTFFYTLNSVRYSSTPLATFLNVHAGDIGKTTPVTFPYFGANGKANIQDVSMITGPYWQKLVPSSTNPTSPLGIADIDGGSKVTIIDVTYVTGAAWQKSWTAP